MKRLVIEVRRLQPDVKPRRRKAGARYTLEVDDSQWGPWIVHSIHSVVDENSIFQPVPEDFATWSQWRWQIRDYSGVDEVSDKALIAAIRTEYGAEADDVESLLVKVVEHFPGLSFKERVLFMHLLYKAFMPNEKKELPGKPAGAGSGT